MGRPVNIKSFSNTNPNSLKVTVWTSSDTGPAAGFINRQRSEHSFGCFSGSNVANVTVCTLTNATPTVQGQATLKCFPFGADGSNAGLGAKAAASMGLVGGNVYTDVYGTSYGGENYAVNDVINFNIGTNSVLGNLSVAAVSGSGAITQLTVHTAGTYTALPANILDVVPTSTTGSGTGAQLSLNFGVSAVTVTTPGTGYVPGGVNVSFNSTADLDFGTDAVAAVTTITSGGVTTVSVTSPGSGYTTVPTVEFINTNSGAFEYVARLSDRKVVTWGGNVYRWFPSGTVLSNTGPTPQCNLDTL